MYYNTNSVLKAIPWREIFKSKTHINIITSYESTIHGRLDQQSVCMLFKCVKTETGIIGCMSAHTPTINISITSKDC